MYFNLLVPFGDCFAKSSAKISAQLQLISTGHILHRLTTADPELSLFGEKKMEKRKKGKKEKKEKWKKKRASIMIGLSIPPVALDSHLCHALKKQDICALLSFNSWTMSVAKHYKFMARKICGERAT